MKLEIKDVSCGYDRKVIIDKISFEMMGQMNEPVKQMITMFIKQLREELDEPETFDVEVISTKPSPDSIAEIDERLRKPGLTETEIRQSWQPALNDFKIIRKKYLLYPDFE